MTIANICYSQNIGRAYAHILSSNENTSLLAIFYQIQTEAELAQRTHPSSIALAQEHAENALELLREDWTNSTADKAIVVNDIAPILYALDYSVKQDSLDADIEKIVNDLHSAIDEFVYVYVGESILDSPAVQALALVDITNVVDSRYASAFGTYSSKMPTAVGMSEMMTNMMTNNNTFNIKANNSEKPSLAQENNNNTHNHTSFNTSTNISDYQTAQALAIQAQTIFNNRLATKAFPNMTTSTILQLNEGFDMLRASINNKTSYGDVMTIIHGRIHPLLIRANNLM